MVRKPNTGIFTSFHADTYISSFVRDTVCDHVPRSNKARWWESGASKLLLNKVLPFGGVASPTYLEEDLQPSSLAQICESTAQDHDDEEQGAETQSLALPAATEEVNVRPLTSPKWVPFVSRLHTWGATPYRPTPKRVLIPASPPPTSRADKEHRRPQSAPVATVKERPPPKLGTLLPFDDIAPEAACTSRSQRRLPARPRKLTPASTQRCTQPQPKAVHEVDLCVTPVRLHKLHGDTAHGRTERGSAPGFRPAGKYQAFRSEVTG
mmetsp:Transcript_55287/g.131857  ORF Transcript_55287/g.131857 Transcript_55287/m.131857 type:complete len:266 (-) Transcript_55287:58-855(-)